VSATSVAFSSHATVCRGVLECPADGEARRWPLVILAHGIAAEQDFGLAPFVERFRAAGYATLRFDYRGFGASDGEPRYLVAPRRHIEDLHAAIDFARACPEVDAGRIALWGTSFGGGHVLEVAARRQDVRAVIAQVPFLDGLASLRAFPLGFILRGAAAGLRDLAGTLLGWPPYYVPVIAERGLRLLSTPDSFQGYGMLVPPESRWENRVPARIFCTVGLYRPAAAAHRVRAPILLVVAEHDTLVPAAAARRLARRVPNCRLEILACGHFDPYRGEVFERAIAREVAFLRDHMPPGAREG